MSKKKAKSLTSAVDILNRRYVKTPADRARIEQARREMAIGQKIFDARTKAGMTQAELAKKIGTQPSAISRLEDADYDGHSLGALHKVADALGMTLVVELR